MLALIRISDAIKAVLEKVAFASGWLLVLLAAITCIDVFSRKFSIPIPLTKFQEFEWHVHCTVFSMWMGYNICINAHPRVDSYTENLSHRTRAWFEFWGLLILALPFMLTMIYYGWDFFWTSFWQNEFSENPNGLPLRWAIKGVFYAGLWLVLLGLISVLLRLIPYLFAGMPQEQARLEIGKAELEV